MSLFIAILVPTVLLGALGAVFGLGLAVASRQFAVKTDPRLDEIMAALPGANCGACGFPGCSGYAEAIMIKNAGTNLCPVGKSPVAEIIARIMGKEAVAIDSKLACVFCRGGREETSDNFIYKGIGDCRAANLVNGGPKACEYGCLGRGSCAAACPFGAIVMNDNRLPVVDRKKCTGCGKCVGVCPRGIIALVKPSEQVFVYCHSHAKGTEVRKVCKAGCIACGICVKNCPEKAIEMHDNLAYIDHQKCTGCGVCVGKCPAKTINYVEPLAKQAIGKETAS
ncbi:MAG: RnfABCDGE type electron transport complex subunit B [Bacillota bacterium]